MKLGMLSRRSFVASATLSAACLPRAAGAAGALPVPPEGRLAFTVLRDGSPVGTHVLTFERQGAALAVHLSVALRVRFAGLTLFTYSAEGVERWAGDTWESAEVRIDNNGKRIVTTARRVSAGYAVSGTDHDLSYTAPPETRPETYWNKAALHAPMLNLQTARTTHAPVVAKGWFSLPEPDGPLVAERYDIENRMNVAVYYDRNDAWSGLAFQRDGAITYRKMA